MKKNIIPFVIILLVIPSIFILSIRLQKSSEEELVKRYSDQQILVAREVSYSIGRFLKGIEDDLNLANYVISGSTLNSGNGFEKDVLFLSGYFMNIENICAVFIIGNNELRFFPKENKCRSIDRKALREAIKLTQQGDRQLQSLIPGSRQRQMIILPTGSYNSAPDTDNEYIIGCLIDVTGLAEQFAKPLKTSERSYAWIIGSDGNLVHHPFHKEMEGRNILKNTEECFDCHTNRFETERKMLSGNSGTAVYGIKGNEDKLVVYYPINLISVRKESRDTGKSWAIAISVPYTDVTHFIASVNRNIIILSGASIILIFFVGMYTIVINSRRVRIEEMMKWSREIIETKNRLETLFDGITDGICIIDKDYRIITMNRAMEEMMDVEGDAYESDFCYKQFAKRDNVCDVCPVKDTLTTGKPYQIERELSDSDSKKIRHWMIYTFPIRNADGDVFQVIKYVRDITAQKRIGEELELSKRLSAVGQMIAGIAHEIKNPLQNVSMGISLLKYDFGDNIESRKTLEGVSEGVKKLNTIVSDLLDFSRPLNIEVFDYNINEVLDEVLSEFEQEFALKGISIKKNYQKGALHEPVIKLDAFKIKQVFSNLLQNAAEAMPKGGIIVVTSISDEEDGKKKVTVKIRDSGIGISRENIYKVFDPFFTTKSKGVGLGMAIVKRIIELHKGTISVESKEGSWTEFTIVFTDEVHHEA
ncbi:MAG: PAS domain-containing protein [Candidatus Schekmanbacteria bacterium]|nr:PAS domain-containing protein [Candidatus Schekmanbacteria bacterium]